MFVYLYIINCVCYSGSLIVHYTGVIPDTERAANEFAATTYNLANGAPVIFNNQSVKVLDMKVDGTTC